MLITYESFISTNHFGTIIHETKILLTNSYFIVNQRIVINLIPKILDSIVTGIIGICFMKGLESLLTPLFLPRKIILEEFINVIIIHNSY